MKGVMFVAEGRAELIDEPMPVCTDETMLLRTLFSGLSNGTERSFLCGGNYGHGRPYPKRIAYQQVSEVVECGSSIEAFAPGDVVFIGTSGGHCEFRLAKETDLIVKLPAGFDLEAGALMGVAAVSYHDAKRGRTAEGDRALVLGDGLIGQFAAQAANVLRAEVTLAGHHDDRLEAARACGIEAAVNNVSDEARDWVSAGAPYDVVFECSGGDVMDTIIGVPGSPGLVGRRSRARVVMVAGRFDVTYNFNAAGAAEVDIIHTQHFDQEDLDELVAHVGEGSIAIRPLIRDVVPLSDAVEVFDRLRDDPRSLFGTVFKVGEV